MKDDVAGLMRRVLNGGVYRGAVRLAGGVDHNELCAVGGSSG
ncbi:MAG: hypothetical protein ACR2NN_01230 [Bryobacteraceae bacterium]